MKKISILFVCLLNFGLMYSQLTKQYRKVGLDTLTLRRAPSANFWQMLSLESTGKIYFNYTGVNKLTIDTSGRLSYPIDLKSTYTSRSLVDSAFVGHAIRSNSIDSLDNLLDVNLSGSVPTNSLLKYNGSKWINSKTVDTINFTSLLNNPLLADGKINIGINSAGKGISLFSTNSYDAIGMYINSRSSGIGVKIDLDDANGLDIKSNNANDTSIVIRNNSSGQGLYINNTSTGKGIYLLNSSTSYGLDLLNSSTGRGINLSNTSNGIGQYIFNDAAGIGQYINSDVGAAGIGQYIYANGGTGMFINYIDGSSSGYLLKNTSNNKTAKLINITDKDSIPLFYIKNDTTVINNKVKASALNSDLGKYNLTINSATHEVYAQQLAHAMFGYQDSTISMSLSSNATWYKVSGKNTTTFRDIESDYVTLLTADTIRLDQAAHWEFHYHVNFIGGSGVYFKARLYNVTQSRAIEFENASTASGAGNWVNVGNTGYCTFCNSGDKIILQMQAETNTQTIDLKGVSILVKATHGTK